MNDSNKSSDTNSEQPSHKADAPRRDSGSLPYANGAHVEVDHTKLLKIMGGILLASFIFGWASIPLYRMVCAKFEGGGSAALNGEVEEYKDVKVDTSRNIHVRFSTVVNRQLPWDFEPEVGALEVHAGEKRLTHFKAHNLSATDTIIGKAVYDIVPAEAAPYFKKIQCFCFTQQTLGPNESVDMPLYFWFEPDMPEKIKDVTIAYTFFKVDTVDQPAEQAPTKTARAGSL